MKQFLATTMSAALLTSALAATAQTMPAHDAKAAGKEMKGAAASATAAVAALGASGVTGTVTLTGTKDGAVLVEVSLDGLKPGKHGFHVHEFGDCSSADGKSAGPHFNPGKGEHGSMDGHHHAGDLGNLVADDKGHAKIKVKTTQLSLTEGPNCVLGRSFVVHAKEDDLKTQPSGDSGDRIACGVVMAKDGSTTPVMNTAAPAAK